MRIPQYILIFIILVMYSCSPSSSGTAIAFLWDEEPASNSSKIMVLSDLTGEELLNETVTTLGSIGFVIEASDDERIITEPKDVSGGEMRLTLELSDNVVIISGEQSAATDDGEAFWATVMRGEEDNGTAQWNMMEVVAHSIDNTSIRYN